ncbi:MAG TPA: extracellular solute-binding protein [Candidatus Paceibacterota bacterium]
MTRFQIIFSAIVVLLGVAGIATFALSKSGSGSNVPQLVMWGTLRSEVVSGFLSSVESDVQKTFKVTYVQKSPATIESEMIAQLARGMGPDMILMPQDFIVKQLDKFYIVPFENYSERTFKDSFIQEGELYLAPDGIIGFPFTVDPLVMYWNRDILTNEGYSRPPTSWTEFFTMAPKIVKRDGAGNISQALIAFGETRNVTHAKNMIALLSIQAGTPIVSFDSQGNIVSVFDEGTGGLIPSEQALSYFVEFSNPNKSSYSWNRSMPNDKTAFAAGKLAVYFGSASELASIRAANPNLNFDVAAIPQTSGASGNKVAFGSMNAIAIVKASPNPAAAFIAATNLSGLDLQTRWTEYSGFPPVRRDMFATLPSDAYKSVFYQSALIAKGWLDPDKEGTNEAFMRMVDNVTSGKMRVSEAVRAASLEMDRMIANTAL